MTKKPSAPTRAVRRTSTRKQNLPTLQWWRGNDNASYDTVELRKALRQIWVLAYPDAPAAIAGDEAIAIRIGLHVYAKADAPAWLIDWTGSLLLLATLDGSLTAATVLIHLRRRVRATKAAAKRRRAL
ncbi:MAG: hypothetical protein JSR61_17135 [Proteobacteria bacterium]|jgi:hypothetical protein|nr:hypothetical protein [Pseudomonadota bacterium]